MVDMKVRATRVHALPFLAAPKVLIAWVAGVIAVWVGLVTAGFAATTTYPSRDLAVLAAVLGCALVCVIGSRRDGEAAGVSRDLLATWLLPVAFLLPPQYVGLMMVPILIIKQRITPGLLHRRIFTMAATGLGYMAASVLFHGIGGAPLTGPFAAGRSLYVEHPAVTVGLALLAGGVSSTINTALVATAARLNSPEVRWWSIATGDGESRVLDLAEVCLGLIVAVGLCHSPLMLAVTLPPVLLVQRSLTHGQLRAAARTDPKTGLLNAATWEQETQLELIKTQRRDLALAILIIDLDHFKAVNDSHGHLIGDQVLGVVANSLRTGLRDGDILGRFGGEEFTLALPDTDPIEAYRVAERLRRLVGTTPTVVDESLSIYVTVSIGAAAYRANGLELNELLTTADSALYRAKHNGRNRVELAPGYPLVGTGVAAG